MSDPDQLPPERLTATELLTLQFYGWERRGRGWDLYDSPVSIEPPFTPFFRRLANAGSTRPPDDGRKATWLTTIAERLREYWNAPAAPVTPVASDEEPAGVEYDLDLDTRWTELAVVLPAGCDVNREAAEQLVVSLSTCPSPISFEMIGTPEAIVVQLACHQAEADVVMQQVGAYFPDAIVEERCGFLDRAWRRAAWYEELLVDFGLSDEFMRPVKTFRNFSVDPLISLAGALGDTRSGEAAVLQVLFRSCQHPWSPSILRSVADGEGGSFFLDAPEMLPLAKQKISRPLTAVLIRAGAKSGVRGRAEKLMRGLARALGQFADPTSNGLIPLTNDNYAHEAHERDLLHRHSHRSGMILNTEELVGLVHPPSASIRLAKLDRERRKTKAAPATVVGHELLLGENRHAGKAMPVTLSAEQRSRHIYLIGASGTGKSTLLLNLIAQDLRSGQGIGVLDPHGDLIDAVLGLVPAERYDDVVLLDPSDDQFPVGFNILSAHSELERTLLASDLAAIFRRFSTSFGDQMQAVLSNAILAILDNDRGGTLLDLRRFLVEKPFRDEYLRSVTDPEIQYYFQREFSLLKGSPQAPILTRLNTFLRPKPIRYMVAQREGLDFSTIMNGGKIFLAKLSHGLIGEENSHLLGALLVTKFHQLAMGRQEMAAAGRRPFTLYIDEFHNFVTPSVASILSAARKYRLGLVLAHQEMRQLWDQDAAVGSAVLTNPCTRICFRVGDWDAKKLAEGFSSFTATDLQSLGVGEAICRVERAEHDFTLTTPPPPTVEPSVAEAHREEILRRSRARYARPRAEVEALLDAARTEAQAANVPNRPPRPAPMEPPRSVPSQSAPAPTLTPVDTPVRPSAEKKAPPSAASSTPLLGRGGRQHKYLQHLVKRLAEDRGYRAVIEQPILAGAGSVDVSLEKGERRIACEISVTTETDHEIDNIQKCLAGGYETVVALSSDAKVVRRLKERAAPVLGPETFSRVRFLQPEDLVLFLDELAAGEASGETTVRGYRVKRRYQPVSPEQAELRKQAIAKVLGRTRR
ncbi:type IV secretion system DNA-binding domain-containing protein [bacterium]|nr:type IV secretion system DNA-binding domain-containing protein [bacterium]